MPQVVRVDYALDLAQPRSKRSLRFGAHPETFRAISPVSSLSKAHAVQQPLDRWHPPRPAAVLQNSRSAGAKRVRGHPAIRLQTRVVLAFSTEGIH